MDVILLKDVERLGTEGTLVHVKPGFARNYLVPRGLAAPATAQQLKAVEATLRQRSRKAERIKTEAEALKQKLEGRSLTLTLNLGADGKPFGAITLHDIREALRTEGFEVEKHAIHLKQPMKGLGVYDIPVRLHPDVTATVKVAVVQA
ncbi:MAG: 50S ribosomal protein L9 [Candidatus Omnitrophica bacterium]|nr:50S ribosomal protein L9 [Candidatus Omnitrophota bacterium]MBI2496310.1 50S ribosomal protein L9 [Candidatus Omnitrophota bacterium]MBI3020805.1 50S ribosomal protein L9 [Candidatus Omnitrophota bacterium]